MNKLPSFLWIIILSICPLTLWAVVNQGQTTGCPAVPDGSMGVKHVNITQFKNTVFLQGTSVDITIPKACPGDCAFQHPCEWTFTIEITGVDIRVLLVTFGQHSYLPDQFGTIVIPNQNATATCGLSACPVIEFFDNLGEKAAEAQLSFHCVNCVVTQMF
ncbi:MAG: hypothetical protein ACE5H3_04275 [Planctomycetota bacterium]